MAPTDNSKTKKERIRLPMGTFIYRLSLSLSLSFLLLAGSETTGQAVVESALAPDEQGNIIPDFSNVGYMGGGEKLPDVKTIIELSPNPTGDDRQRIQAALDEIGKKLPDENGFRGALLLKAGEYRVNGSIWVTNSGIVLRGEGQFPGGTAIIATEKDTAPFDKKHSLVYLGKPEPSWPRLGFLKKGAETEITDQRVPVGSKQIHVRSTEGLKVGDNIIIELYPNMKWLETLKLENVWGEELKGFYHRYERKITGIKDNQLTLDAPLVSFIDKDLLEKASVWKYSDNVRISQSGVERIRLISVFNKDDPEDEEHALAGIIINHARDCWVKNVTALHFSFAAVAIRSGARNITVQDCACLRPVSLVMGNRRYPFHLDGSMSLVQRCYARDARHGYSSSARAPGPNVFLDCLSEKAYADIGPHHRWATGYLYDNILAPQGTINAQNVGKSSKHGWRGVNQVFWNCKAAQIICDEPPTGDKNWSIGSVASKRPGKEKERFGTWISHGTRVEPRSLYLWQLENRLGKTAVENITIDVQRQEDSDKIYDYLKTTFAELNKREQDDDNNLLLDPEFNTSGDGSPWAIKERREQPFDFDEYNDPRNLIDTLIRTTNPVYGDDSAIIVPAGKSIRVMPFLFMNFSDPSAKNIFLNLKFNYKMAAKTVLDVAVMHNTIRTGTDEEGFGLFTYGKTRWEKTQTFIGPAAKGDGQWQEYRFEFTLAPEFYKDTNTSYPIALAIRFSSESEFAIANPSLEISRDKETKKRGSLK